MDKAFLVIALGFAIFKMLSERYFVGIQSLAVPISEDFGDENSSPADKPSSATKLLVDTSIRAQRSSEPFLPVMRILSIFVCARGVTYNP